MTNSEFLAGLIGPLLLAMGLALLVDRDAYRRMIGEIANNSVVVFLAGVVTLVASLALVRLHNVWDGWPVIITVFGWLGVIGGAARIIFAGQAARIAEAFAPGKSITVIAVAFAAVGAFLSLKGYQLI